MSTYGLMLASQTVRVRDKSFAAESWISRIKKTGPESR